jgi:hypothetical protein
LYKRLWAKQINDSMKGWLAAADIVFTHAREPHVSLFTRAGARDVRYRPETYCHVNFSYAEETDPLTVEPIRDVTVIGNRLGRWGGLSRIPGTASRARLVRRLQRDGDLRLAVYGSGWSGRGAMGALRYDQQAKAIRESLVSANWDHFDRYEDYVSDRLPISMIAGRPHVTTSHAGSDPLPGEEVGVFREASVRAIETRVRDLLGAPPDELLDLGKTAHSWARVRMSDRESARFMLGAVDRRLLAGLSEEPWLRLAGEWPR